MHLKMRPMSEAPLNESLLLWLHDEPRSLASIQNREKKENFCLGWQGFVVLADLLHAAEIMAAITPEGYEYDEVGPEGVSADLSSICRSVFFRRIAPPVEYEYVTDGSLRYAKDDEYLWREDQFVLAKDSQYGRESPRLCYRRVEVKR